MKMNMNMINNNKTVICKQRNKIIKQTKQKQKIKYKNQKTIQKTQFKYQMKYI